jgi:hypothetical protein
MGVEWRQDVQGGVVAGRIGGRVGLRLRRRSGIGSKRLERRPGIDGFFEH